ncbi:MAG: hypothetical protein PHY29_00600 [Syntrophales bacterium]|nr:hypothetical protein [Syntrophales bacterium]
MKLTPLIYVVIGILLLVGGRKFFWFFVGAIGFITGFTLADHLLGVESFIMSLSVGIIAGVIGVAIAVFLQGFAIFVGGFLAGSYIAYMIVTSFGLVSQEIFWIAYVSGGIVGALLLFLLFDWALIILSSAAGGSIITDSFTLEPMMETAIAIVLALLGILIQSKILMKEKKSF